MKEKIKQLWKEGKTVKQICLQLGIGANSAIKHILIIDKEGKND